MSHVGSKIVDDSLRQPRAGITERVAFLRTYWSLLVEFVLLGDECHVVTLRLCHLQVHAVLQGRGTPLPDSPLSNRPNSTSTLEEVLARLV